MDYEKLGFKCGIEIHQQLEGAKLFSGSPTEIRKDESHYKVNRRLRASAGESGKIDKAAKHEQKKHKHFLYSGYYDSISLVELDEEPPTEMNKEALESTLQLCKLLNAKPVDIIQVMRKTVIDGSNVSGFQRTMLIGRNGYVEVGGRKIGIESICLEEEACQVIERKSDFDNYNLSRLGIPLIEIATAPDIRNAEECKEVAAKIGSCLRQLNNCKRGIGSIRQDVNLSIKGQSRVEIKGFQDLKSIPKVIEYEVNRHLKEIKKGKKIQKEVRKAEPDFTTSFLRPMPGADRMYPETDIPELDIQGLQVAELKDPEEELKEMVDKYGIKKEAAKEIIKENIDIDFFIKEAKLDPAEATSSAIEIPKEIKKRFNAELDISNASYREVLRERGKGKIPFSAVKEIGIKIAKKEKYNIKDFYTISDSELEKEIKQIIAKNKNAPMGALMGQAMAKFRGKADGKKVMELLKKHSK